MKFVNLYVNCKFTIVITDVNCIFVNFVYIYLLYNMNTSYYQLFILIYLKYKFDIINTFNG